MRPRANGVAAALALAGLLAAQAPCPRCEGRGVVACRACGPRPDGVLAGTAADACRTCRGAFAVACDRCADAAAAAELAAAREASARWVAALAARLLDAAPDDLRACRSAHFDLGLATPPIADAPDAPEQVYLHAQRLEAGRARLAATFGLDPAALPPRLALFVVADRRQHARLARATTQQEPQGLGNRRAGTAALLAPKEVRDDRSLHGLLAHAAAHLLLAPSLGDDDDDRAGALRWSWLREAIASEAEDAAVGRCVFGCVQGHPQPPASFFGGDWRAAARALLDQDRLPPLADLLATEASDLDLAQRALAFALVDFAISQQPAPVTHGAGQDADERRPAALLLRAAAKGEAPGTAMRRAFGQEVAATEQALRAFVRDRYGGR